MNACPDILHSSKPTRHPGIGVEFLHDGLSHSEVVGVSSGLQAWTRQLELTSDTSDPSSDHLIEVVGAFSKLWSQEVLTPMNSELCCESLHQKEGRKLKMHHVCEQFVVEPMKGRLFTSGRNLCCLVT